MHMQITRSGLSESTKARMKFSTEDCSNIIQKGSHYLEAEHGFYTFDEIGLVEFHGRPVLGLGNTDTIYRRLEDAILPRLGVSSTIPIEVVSLTMQSKRPIRYKRKVYDMFIYLTPGTRSLGEMTIVQEYPNVETSSTIPNGTFHQNVNLFFTAKFIPHEENAPWAGPDVAGEFEHSGSVYIATLHPGTWSFNPWSNFVTVTKGSLEELTTNFFITDSVFMLSNDYAAGGSKHTARLSRDVLDADQTVQETSSRRPRRRRAKTSSRTRSSKKRTSKR